MRCSRSGACGRSTIWRGISGILSPASYIGSTLPGGLPFQGTNLLFGLVGQNAIDVGAFDVAFRALQESGKAEILSKPSILCTQGAPAEVVTQEQFEINKFLAADRSTSVNGLGEVVGGAHGVYGAIHAGLTFSGRRQRTENRNTIGCGPARQPSLSVAIFLEIAHVREV